MPPPRNAPPKSQPPGDAAPPDPEASGQCHPLYSADRHTVNRLLAAEPPEDGDLVDAARLLSRYSGFPGAYDVQDDLQRAIRHWGLTPETLQARTRALWQGGYGPGTSKTGAEPVGSGFDSAADAEP